MMAVMKCDVTEPVFPLRAATASPREHRGLRSLDDRELDEVVGGAANLVSGGIGAGLGGWLAVQVRLKPGSGTFSWGTFAQRL